MGSKEQVVLIDDNRDVRGSFGEILREEGHNVVAEAGSVSEALDLILRLDEMKVRVVVLDGNLSPSSTGNADGIRLTKAIREGSKAKVIGLSGEKYPGPEISLLKSDGPEPLLEAIKQI